jgi:hypothetical protein
VIGFMLSFSFKQNVQNIGDSVIGQPIANLGPFPASHDQPGIFEGLEVLGCVGLRDAQGPHGLVRATLPVLQAGEDPESRGVGEGLQLAGLGFIDGLLWGHAHISIKRYIT